MVAMRHRLSYSRAKGILWDLKADGERVVVIEGLVWPSPITAQNANACKFSRLEKRGTSDKTVEGRNLLPACGSSPGLGSGSKIISIRGSAASAAGINRARSEREAVAKGKDRAIRMATHSDSRPRAVCPGLQESLHSPQRIGSILQLPSP